jgi:hypothetical protein
MHFSSSLTSRTAEQKQPQKDQLRSGNADPGLGNEFRLQRGKKNSEENMRLSLRASYTPMLGKKPVNRVGLKFDSSVSLVLRRETES